MNYKQVGIQLFCEYFYIKISPNNFILLYFNKIETKTIIESEDTTIKIKVKAYLNLK